MEGNNFADVFPKNKPALGDITNRLGKRGLTLISDNSINKTAEGKDGISQFTKRVCQGVENIVKEKCAIQSIGNENENKKEKNKSACNEVNLSSENVVSDCWMGRETVGIDNVVKIDEATGDSCDILLPIPTEIKENCDKDEEQDPLYVVEGCSQTGESVTEINGKDIEGIPLGLSVGPESHFNGSFKSEKCKGLMGDSCSNPGSGIDLLKSCSCSFCLKASYIWSDLHYQDIKGRISALKKSQKDASSARERSCRSKQIPGNLYNVSKLESNLTGQWSSLFLHMENIFEREGNQLETSLLSLKDLRDNCKTELEMVNGMPKEKH